MKKIFIKLPYGIESDRYPPFSDFTIISNSNLFSDNVNLNYHKDKYGFCLSDAEINLARLHIEAWGCFFNSNDSYCVIVEENVNFNNNISETIFEDLPWDWDIFFPFEIEGLSFDKRSIGLNRNSHEFYDLEPFFLGYEWSSSVYFLSKSGVKKLLNEILEIKQRIEDEIWELAKHKRLSLFFCESSLFSLENIRNKKFIDRAIGIKKEVLNCNNWPEWADFLIKDMLSYVSKIGEQIGAKLILQAGTHLGYIRHGGIMKWDDDVDLGIQDEKIMEFVSIINNGPYNITKCITSRSKVEFYKIWSHKGQPISKYEYRFPSIDVWIYNISGNDIIFKNVICPNSAKFPLKKIKFEGSDFFITANSIEVLDSRYKDWKTKIRIYSFNHSKESNTNYILATDIQVDQDGKLIG